MSQVQAKQDTHYQESKHSGKSCSEISKSLVNHPAIIRIFIVSCGDIQGDTREIAPPPIILQRVFIYTYISIAFYDYFHSIYFGLIKPRQSG